MALVLPGGAKAAGLYDFNSFSESQQKAFLKRVDTTAFLEAAARACGKGTSIEADISAAVKRCVKPSALARVVSRFRAQMQTSKFADKEKFCADGEVKGIISRHVANVAKLVAQAKSLCQGCVNLGICS